MKLEQRAAATAGIYFEAETESSSDNRNFRCSWSREQQRQQEFTLKFDFFGRSRTVADALWSWVKVNSGLIFVAKTRCFYKRDDATHRDVFSVKSHSVINSVSDWWR